MKQVQTLSFVVALTVLMPHAAYSNETDQANNEQPVRSMEIEEDGLPSGDSDYDGGKDGYL